MPVTHQALFTLDQVEAIEEALTPKTHLFDLRMGLPLLGKGAYFVFMGGPNRRQSKRQRLQESPQARHAALSNETIATNRLHSHNPAVYHLLQRIPNRIRATFQPMQIQAMEAALVPRRHLIDIRLSLPFCGKGAYLVFAAGPNQRGHYRDIQNRNPFTMPAVVASILVGAGSILGLIYIKGSAVFARADSIFDEGPKFYQTTVPFKKTQRECMESGRQWIEGKCIDELHDPTF